MLGRKLNAGSLRSSVHHAVVPPSPLHGLGQHQLPSRPVAPMPSTSGRASPAMQQGRGLWRCAAAAVDTDVEGSPGQLLSPEERREFVMQEARTFLEAELKRIFSTGEVTRARYSPTIKFEDPITAYNDLDGYVFNINLLRTLFKVGFQTHSVDITGPNEVTARWTMSMQMWLLPWKPTLVFTGRTFYKVDLEDGKILSHIDAWDALEHNQFLSLEGALLVLRQFFQVQLTPNIESHEYKVLKKLKEYEIRYYPSYLVAETSQPSGSGPASGSGFTELAGYIFGGNREKVKMEMTTPVLSTVTPEGNRSMNMQFVMESRFKDVDQLPTPLDSKVVKKQAPGGYFAAITFSGWPLDFEVVQNERTLRDALLRDGLSPTRGYVLARYNEPTVLPMFRRNEVLIELQDFAWPPPPASA